MSFTHLHLHTEYSLLDGACRIPKLVERIKALGMTSCAITDHGVMYGCIDFYSAMKDAGIKPIIGCEVYVCRDRLDKSAANREYSHLILLCENNTGYQNLMKLVSEGFLTGYYYRPRIDYNLIRQHSEGLICLSACLSGDLPKLLLQGRYDDAEAYVREMQDIFGEKNFYVEIMDHGIREEKIVMPRLISLAREMNVPLVATNDCHYLEEKDADAQEVLLCIQTGKTLDDANRMRMDTRQLYVKSEDEMRTLFASCPDAIDRTQEIADRCNVEFEFGVTRLPHYPVPEGETALSMLTRLTHAGLRERYPDAKETDEPWQRLNYELNVISSMGYVDYFLIVWDFIRYAKSQGIMVGPGRGSGAGSIVAYSLGITMLGVMAFWTGILEIGRRAGLIEQLSAGMRPVLHFLFPRIPAGHPALSSMAANMIANMLGLGWACTPAGLKAMEQLAKLEEQRREQRQIEQQGMQSVNRQSRPGTGERLESGRHGTNVSVASNEMCTFLILNISSLQLIPVNMIAYRSRYGSANPAVIIAPALVATLFSTIISVIYCKWKDR